MPYERKSELPKQVRDNLPSNAQDIYRKAYNSAYDQYDKPKKREGNASREETAHKVAWNAVKNEYTKEGGEWKRKAET